MLGEISQFKANSLFSKIYRGIFRKVYLTFRPEKVKTCQDLIEFLHDFSTRASGGLVLSYAQKRTGKLHFKLAKEKDYADDLIRAQIGLHAEVVSDLWFLTLVFLKLPRKPLQKIGTEIIKELHTGYLETSPTDTKMSSALKKRHFAPKEKSIKEFSEKSGKVLFDLLPLTENLLDSNLESFVGQLRLRYIGYFEKLDARLDRDSIAADFKKLMP